MVSVIIPIYNVEKYLCECIDSVIKQSYKDLEIILVDDGSQDNCGKICDCYALKDKRIKVIHKKNGGLSDARNVGYSKSHGEYIYFLDSDDYIKVDAIAKMVTCIKKENSDIVFFDAETLYEIFPDSNYRENFIRSNCYQTSKGTLVLRKLIKNREYYSCVPLHFFKRELIEKNKLSFVKGIMHEDELFTILAYVKADKVSQLRDIAYIRRFRANSIMSDRISVKSIMGMYRCIWGCVKEEKKYFSNSMESSVLRIRIKDMSRSVISKYSDLSKKNRVIAKPYIIKIAKTLHSYKFFGSRRIFFQYLFSDLYVKYKSIKKVRHFICRL